MFCWLVGWLLNNSALTDDTPDTALRARVGAKPYFTFDTVQRLGVGTLESESTHLYSLFQACRTTAASRLTPSSSNTASLNNPLRNQKTENESPRTAEMKGCGGPSPVHLIDKVQLPFPAVRKRRPWRWPGPSAAQTAAAQ